METSSAAAPRIALRELRQRIGGSRSMQSDGTARIDRAIFSDPEIFDLELRHLFERNWVYVAHESQVAKPFDFITTHIGRQPVVVTRDQSGEIRCMINACSHRGAIVYRNKSGNRRNQACGFHGWVYNVRGELVGVTSEDKGAYPPSFDKGTLGLHQARVGNYRGFLFASLEHDVAPLEQYLGTAAGMIDMLVDQAPDGRWEILRGTTAYTYHGNWKLAAENGVDGYHASTVHASYVDITMKRMRAALPQGREVFDLSKVNELPGGFQTFENGHAMVWTQALNERVRPSYRHRDEFIRRHGEETTSWMLGRLRNLILAPNVFLMDSMSTQVRIIRPLSVDRTEVTTYCLAPVSEDAASRTARIRQYEDFYNATGLATPDDLSEFNYCQDGFAARTTPWSDLSRGGARRTTASEAARRGDVDAGDEGIYIGIYEDWARRMLAAVDSELGVVE